MAHNHYVVGYNMPGYLPDSDVVFCRTKAAAQDAAQEIADMFRDEYYVNESGHDVPAWRVYGNKRVGYDIESTNSSASYVVWIDVAEQRDYEEYMADNEY
jgi:hypothetical protein